MKKLLSVLALTAFISGAAYAEDAAPKAAAPAAVKKKKKKAVTVKTTTATTTTKTSTHEDGTTTHHSSSTAKNIEFSGSLGLGSAASKFHFGFGLQAEIPTTLDNNNFRFGLQSGFYYGPSSPSTWIIPILATGAYEFKHDTDGFMPYVGLAMGISISHASAGGLSASSTDFAILFKPGANFGEGKKYFVELPIGTMGGDFCILPSVGMHF